MFIFEYFAKLTLCMIPCLQLRTYYCNLNKHEVPHDFRRSTDLDKNVLTTNISASFVVIFRQSSRKKIKPIQSCSPEYLKSWSKPHNQASTPPQSHIALRAPLPTRPISGRTTRSRASLGSKST